MKSYKIEIMTANNGFYVEDAVGHFIKEPYFVIERENGERLLINNDIIEYIEIDKEWQDE